MIISIHQLAVMVLLLTLGVGQQERSGMPDGSRQAAIHPFVHDPRIVENGPPLSPIPPSTAYSEWTVNSATYVVAYRNVDKDDPHDIVADIYFKNPQNSQLQKLITIPVFSEVDDVKLINITGDSNSQLAFFRTSGQQDWLAIVTLQGPSAHKSFDYGTTSIKLTDDKPPKILAYSHSTDTTETFLWCKNKQKIILEGACRPK